MTITHSGTATCVLLTKDRVEYLMTRAGITKHSLCATIVKSITAIAVAASEEQRSFPNAELAQAVIIDPDVSWGRNWDQRIPVMTLASLHEVVNNPRLIGAVRRRKPFGLTESDMAILLPFVEKVMQL